jgi:hypothetical protein
VLREILVVMRGGVLVLVLLLATCDSASSTPDAAAISDAAADAVVCEQNATVLGSYALAPGMFGEVTSVETWTYYDTEYTTFYLSLTDGSQRLSLDRGGPFNRMRARLTTPSGTLDGTGSFTYEYPRGAPCQKGTFQAAFASSQGMVEGMYAAPYLGENPPR